MIQRGKLSALVLFGVSLVVEGGWLSGWWPLGWPQPLLIATILTTLWWLPLAWHTVLSLGSAILLDSLQASTNFWTTRLVVVVVAINFLRWFWATGNTADPARGRFIVLIWLIGYPAVRLINQFGNLTWPAAVILLLETGFGTGFWWWLSHRLAPSATMS